MHTFQPYPMDLLELNPFTKFSKEWALVTTGSKQKVNTMTVGWGGLGVIWGKNVVYIFVRDSRYTKELLDDIKFFSLAFLDESYREALSICGSKSGRDVDKFQEAGLTPATCHGIPYPDESNLVLLCRTLSSIRLTEDTFIDPAIADKWYKDKDMHTMYVGEIIDAMAR